MSILSDKYKIPEETVRKMVKDGVISCSWDAKELAYKMHLQGMTFSEIGHKLGCSTASAYDYYKAIQNKIEGI